MVSQNSHPNSIPEIRYDSRMEPIVSMRVNPIAKDPVPKGKKILIIRASGIGDLIMLSPSLRALKHENPEADITLASEYPDILRGLPYLTSSMINEVNPKDYDCVIDLNRKVESPQVGGILSTRLYQTINRTEMFGRLLGVDLQDLAPDVYLNPSRVARMRSLINPHEDSTKYVGIQATCTSNLRTIPPDYLPGLIERLEEIEGVRVILLGSIEAWSGRKPTVNILNLGSNKTINLIGKLNVEDLAPLISLFSLMIAPDSSAIHIAGALNIRCVALFGNIPPGLRTRHYSSVTTLYPAGELKCVPCYDFSNPCVFYKDIPTERQPIGAECMRRLSPERIYKKVKTIIEGGDDGRKDT